MNCVLKRNNNKDPAILESGGRMEGLTIINETKELHSNTADQFIDLKLSSLDLENSTLKKHWIQNNMASTNLAEEDILCYYDLKSTSLCNEIGCSIVDPEKAGFSEEINFYEINQTIEKVEQKYPDELNIDFRGSQKLEKVQEPQYNSGTFSLNKNKAIACHNNPESHNDESVTSVNIECINRKRWGRKEDVLAFTLLQELCTKENIEIETFWSKDSALSDNHYSLLSELAKRLNWKRNTQKMLKRMKSLGNKQLMSAREVRLLRTLNKRAKMEDKPLKFDEITNLFPGKLASTLELCFKRIYE